MNEHESMWRRFKRLRHETEPSDHNSLMPQPGLPVRASFRLLHNDSIIGTLTEAEDGIWTFRYSEEFQKHPKFRTITEFPELGKIYVSSELWPFFMMRIPSLRQASIKATIEKENIDERDEAKLLKRFGRRTVANPFELVST
jgi:HipA-like protein